MRRMIDSTCEPNPMSKEEIVDTLKTMVFGRQAFERFNAKEREALDKSWNLIDQYENRLKADMVAMLTEIQLEIEETEMGDNVPFGFEPVNKFYEGVSASSKVIQQKIDALKAENEDGNDD